MTLCPWDNRRSLLFLLRLSLARPQWPRNPELSAPDMLGTVGRWRSAGEKWVGGRRGRKTGAKREVGLTSKMNLELPKLVFCFCQKLSGLMMRATWISAGKASCSVLRRGLMRSHLEPRMSMMTVKPRLHTSSLWGGQRSGTVTLGHWDFGVHSQKASGNLHSSLSGPTFQLHTRSPGCLAIQLKMYCLRKPFEINPIWPRSSAFSQHLASNSTFPVVNCTCWDVYSFGIHYYVWFSFNSCLSLLLLGWIIFSPFEYKLSRVRDAVALRSAMESPWHERCPSPGPRQWQPLLCFTTEPNLSQRIFFNKGV